MDSIILGDCLEVMRGFADDSVDLLCTDPPYGYSFMGKDWDKAVPSVEIWKECLRVLKPGAFAFVMSAPRSDVQYHMIQNLTEAGFRLDFTPIYWTYASGFPKAGNIGKMVDKRLGAERDVVGERQDFVARRPKNNFEQFDSVNPSKTGVNSKAFAEKMGQITAPSSNQAKALDGSYAGFQPKPAVEVIIVAMKPLSEKTYVDQALKNGKGITWLDDCRVPTDDNTERPPSLTDWEGGYKGGHEKNGGHESGRFPANLIVSDDVLNDGVERKSTASTYNWTPSDNQDTPSKMLQSTIKSGIHHGDSGSYSRYFDLDKWASTLPFLIVPKASKSEKNKGLEHLPEKFRKTLDGGSMSTEGKRTEDPTGAWTRNSHPTVKPLKLMSYLITLGSREGDVVLDPFVGSGTTCLAAKKLERNYIGIEQDTEYAEIAQARLDNVDILKQEVLL